MARRAALPERMWAAIQLGDRAEWINPITVRRTRKQSREAYLAIWDPAYLDREPGNRARILSRVRFARVTVTLETPDV